MSTVSVLAGRVMQPDELGMVQDVFGRLKAEGYVPGPTDEQQAFAAYILKMYLRGMVFPDRLYALGVAAAKERLDKPASQRQTVGDIHLPACKVLIVEDDPLQAKNVKRAFEQAGAIILGPVSNEEDALFLLQTDVPDLAVIDLDLGDGVKFEVAASLRDQAVPVFILSAYRRDNVASVPASVEGTPWLDKPASPEVLLFTAANALVGG